MTTFEPHSSGNSVMDTMMTATTYAHFEAMSVVGGDEGQITDLVNMAAHAYKQYEDYARVGKTLLAVRLGEAEEPVAPLPISNVREDEPLQNVVLQVIPAVAEYLRAKSSADDSKDLVPFWDSAYDFYRRLSSLHLSAWFEVASPDGGRERVRLVNSPYRRR